MASALSSFRQVVSAVSSHCLPHEALAREIRSTVARLVSVQGALTPPQSDHLVAALAYGWLEVVELAQRHVQLARLADIPPSELSPLQRRTDGVDLAAQLLDEVERFTSPPAVHAVRRVVLRRSNSLHS